MDSIIFDPFVSYPDRLFKLFPGASGQSIGNFHASIEEIL